MADKRKTVAIDLDGVLLKYDGWKGVEHFGEPIEGAVEFTKRLHRKYRVVIHTCRVNQDNLYDENSVRCQTISQLTSLVSSCLEAYGFAWDDIWMGRGKPMATAYIDDKALICDPQAPGSEVAFGVVLAALLRKHP